VARLKDKISTSSLRGLRIEVCGGIASGKTTFARLMNKKGLKPLFENFKDNPFWRAFYNNPGKFIFETEVTFTLLHYHQIKRRIEEGSDVILCDFSFVLDLAYAKIGLDGSKLNAFENVLSEIYEELGALSLLVHLKCDANTELERIRRRARKEESSINLDFLAALNQAVESEVLNIQGQYQLVTIDSGIKDFANDENIKKEMTGIISDFISTNL
jgi:deoxyguanosine kinase